MSDDYKPVSCATHSEYELAIMHRQKLQLHWHNKAGNERVEEVTPTDMITRNQAEYLLVKTNKHSLIEIRLDRIFSCTKTAE
jgi:transcriptional antiterminator Rof (Rho-off)